MVVGRDQAANDQENDNQNHKFHIVPLPLDDCRVAFPIAAAMSLIPRALRENTQTTYNFFMKLCGRQVKRKERNSSVLAENKTCVKVKKLREQLSYAALGFRSNEPSKPRTVDFAANSSIRCLT